MLLSQSGHSTLDYCRCLFLIIAPINHQYSVISIQYETADQHFTFMYYISTFISHKNWGRQKSYR